MSREKRSWHDGLASAHRLVFATHARLKTPFIQAGVFRALVSSAPSLLRSGVARVHGQKRAWVLALEAGGGRR